MTVKLLHKLGLGDAQDETLLQRYKDDGDQRWISALFGRYVHMIFGVCLRYCPDAREAEDLTMEVYEIIVDKAKSHNIKSFKSWLYVVTKNHCLQQLRQLTGQPIEHFDPKFMQFRDEVHPFDDDGMPDWQTREIRFEMIEDCLEGLNALQRSSIEKFYYKNMSYSDIAKRMDISVGQVRSFLQNGRRNLKNCVERLLRQ